MACAGRPPLRAECGGQAIAPILLEDYRKISVERKGEKNFFTSAMIKRCMSKVITVDLHQTVRVDDELEIKAYYAGHVLGAAMFRIKVGDQSLVYTGDYNMTPDRHLGAAWIDKCRPDVIITESTYATTIRDSKRCRERNFLKKVHDCVERGGKVLIPVFALGRAQELCILLETYWERHDLKVPIYFSAGLTEKANHYYKLFIAWTNQKIKKTFGERNMFEFRHILPFDRSYADNPGPQVLFATPGMLHAGLSLQVFAKWAPDPRNMVIMPGYCVAGTMGAKVIAGHRKVDVGAGVEVEVNLAVEHLSFSAHADAKGIMQLIKQSGARHVVLVHGEAKKMDFLAKRVRDELGVPCCFPANGESVDIETRRLLPVAVSTAACKRPAEGGDATPKRGRAGVVEGLLVMSPAGALKLIAPEEAGPEIGLPPHALHFSSAVPLPRASPEVVALLPMRLAAALTPLFPGVRPVDGGVAVGSVTVAAGEGRALRVRWPHDAEELAARLVGAIEGCRDALVAPA